MPDIQDFYNHYKNINADQCPGDNCDNFADTYIDLHNNDNVLNNPISEDEIRKNYK